MSDQIDPDISGIIEMAWDDETSFEAIQAQTGLAEKDVIAIMQTKKGERSWQ